MSRVLERHGDRLWERVLTERERGALARRRDRAAALAGRWAAKEAAVKACGGRAGALWHDFEVTRGGLGDPQIRFQGRAKETGHRLHVVRADRSITEGGGVAAAGGGLE